MKNKKWKLAVWGMILGTCISVASLVGWVFGADGALGVLGQGLGTVALVLGMYSAANVVQKQVISSNYRPELNTAAEENRRGSMCG
jgi:hypothetical protein